MNDVLKKINDKIVVSCQGNKEDGNPFYQPEHMLMLADAAYRGGASGFRANLPQNVKVIKEKYPDIPMIGIYKIVEGNSEVYITPNMEAVEALIELNSEIIAIDGTNRKNARNQYAWEFIKEVKEKYPRQIVMADIATIEDVRLSAKAGAEIIGTTLSGYTADSLEYSDKANFELIKQIRTEFPDIFIVAEGKIWSPEDADKAFDMGANTVVIGTSINNPLAITQRFIKETKRADA